MHFKTRVRQICAVAAAATTLVINIFAQTNTVKAEEYWPQNVEVSSGAATVVNLDTGAVLYEKNADQRNYPASITKIMTALIAVKYCDLSEEITFSEDAVYKNEGDTSHIAREVGEIMTLENALYGMMVESANECAWAIGEHIGGTMNEFVNMMNKEAKDLGCTGTHFANPNGLHDNDHYVTASDMAKISAEAYKYPKFMELAYTRSYTLPADNKKPEYTLNNTHGLFSNHRTSQYLYEYCIGGKTGFTDEAGNTLVTYARKDGMTLLCVVLADRNPGHYTNTVSLLDYCFQNFALLNIAENANIEDVIDKSSAGSLSENKDLVSLDSTAQVILPVTAQFSDVSAEVIPVKDGGETVAQVLYTYGGQNVGIADVTFKRDENIYYPFKNVAKKNGGAGEKYFLIDIKKIIFLIILAVIIGFAALYMMANRRTIFTNRERTYSRKATRGKNLNKAKSKPQSSFSLRSRRRGYRGTVNPFEGSGKKIERKFRNSNRRRRRRR